MEFEPDRNALDGILAGKGASVEHRGLMLAFFDSLQNSKNPLCRLGHAYFQDCTDFKTASIVWRVSLRPLLKKLTRSEPEVLKQIEAEWAKVINPAQPVDGQAGQQAG